MFPETIVGLWQVFRCLVRIILYSRVEREDIICLSLGGKVCDNTTMAAIIEYNKEGRY